MIAGLKLPDCPCGNSQWLGGSSSMAAGYYHEAYRCQSCRRISQLMLVMSGGAFIIAAEPSQRLPENVKQYIDGPLAEFWQNRDAEIRKARAKLSRERYNGLNAEMGLPLKTVYMHVPDRLLDGWYKRAQAIETECSGAVPPGFEHTLLPSEPAPPREIIIHLRGFVDGKDVWELHAQPSS